MKKTLLITALLCCMMPMMAQKSNDKTPAQKMKKTKQKVEQLNRMAGTYLQKLDSVVEPNLYKEVLEYDELLNCTKNSVYNINDAGNWEIYQIYSYEYDAQNRVISINCTSPSEDWASREILEYDDQGRLSVWHCWSKNDGEWMEIYYTTYEYEVGDNVAVWSVYSPDLSDDNVWYEVQRNEYTYLNGLPTLCLNYKWIWENQGLSLDSQTTWDYDGELCTQMEDWSWNGTEWILQSRYEYTYYDNGNLKEEIQSYDYWGGLEPFTKLQYEYDDHNNVTLLSSYGYYEGWELEFDNKMEYDVTILASNIAGLAIIFGEELDSFYKNKLLKTTTTYAYDGYCEEMNLYYSTASGVNEIAESQLSIWPNPVSETLNLKGDMTQVQIYSVDGRLVMSLEKGFETINVSALATGSYLLKATLNDGSVTTQKFLKK